MAMRGTPAWLNSSFCKQIDHHDETEEPQGHHGDAHLLRRHRIVGFLSLIHRHRRAELGIHEAADHRVGDVTAREQETGAERRRIEQVDGYPHGRAHHHQHHAGRNQDAERAAGGDGTRRQPRVVACPDHHRCGHDAEHRYGGADDAGRHGEDCRGEDDRQIERAAHRRQQAAQRPEQPLHQARLFGHVAHEDEERHGREDLVLHRPPDLQIGKIEGLLPAEPQPAEDDGEKQQREGDRETDEDDRDHADKHDQSEALCITHGAQTSIFSCRVRNAPVRQAQMLFMSSEMPCRNSMKELRGMTPRSGHRIGAHAPEAERSLIEIA